MKRWDNRCHMGIYDAVEQRRIENHKAAFKAAAEAAMERGASPKGAFEIAVKATSPGEAKPVSMPAPRRIDARASAPFQYKGPQKKMVALAS